MLISARNASALHGETVGSRVRRVAMLREAMAAALIMALLCSSTVARGQQAGLDVRQEMQGAVDGLKGDIADLEKQISAARKKGAAEEASNLQQELDFLKGNLDRMQGTMKQVFDVPAKQPAGVADGRKPAAPEVKQYRQAETSDGLILADVASGKLTREQGWRYRLAARFRPGALPPAYRPKVNPSTPPAPHSAGSDNFLAGLASDFASFGPEAKKEFIGYFIPPIYAGSKLPGAKPQFGQVGSEDSRQVSTLLPGLRHNTRSGRRASSEPRRILVQDVQSGATPAPVEVLKPDASWVWDSVESSDLKVWWLRENTRGESAARSLLHEFPRVRAKLDAAMHRTYLSDAGAHHFDGNVIVTRKEGGMFGSVTKEKKFVSLDWGDGGNGKLDIYITEIDGAERAITVPYLPGCSARPSFILMDASSLHYTHGPKEMNLPEWPIYDKGSDPSDDLLQLMLAHEYLHVLQLTFVHGRTCDDYNGVDEGTANWAGEYVYPKNKWLRSRYFDWFHYGDDSLSRASYETWPFYVFVEHTLGVDFIRKIFENYANRAGVDAVNSALPGGFKKQWSEYTVHEWNQGDAVEDFRAWQVWAEVPWDEPHVPTEKVKVLPDARGSFIAKRDIELWPLTRKYFRFNFEDTRIRSIRFDIALGLDPRPTSKARLKALVKHRGKSWEVEDWSTGRDAVEFCQDVPSESVEEVVLAISNYDYQEGSNPWGWMSNEAYRNSLSVQATNLACKGWLGNFTAAIDRDDHGAIDHLETRSHAEFERAGVNETGNFIGRFHARSGAGTYSYLGKRTSSGQVCNGRAAGAFQVARDTAGNAIGLYPHQVGTPNERMYGGALGKIEPTRIEVTFTCPGDMPPVHDTVELAAWFTDPANRFRADAGGNLVGQSTTGDAKYTWDIRPKQASSF